MVPQKCGVFSSIIFAIIYLLILSILRPHLIQSSVAQQHHQEQETQDLFSYIKSELKQQNDRIALLELQNRNQDEDIGLLKKDNMKIHKQIDLMNGEKLNEIGILNSYHGQLHNNDGKADSDYPSINPEDHEKRAARLIPLSLLL